MLKYWGFGLRILSDFEIPELVPHSFDEPDLVIKTGLLPDQLKEPYNIKGAYAEVNANEYLLRIPGIAGYYAFNGNFIIVEPVPGAKSRDVCLFLLKKAIVTIIYQRGMIPLHASAVYDKSGGIIMISGPSKAGKSTLMSLLRSKGYELFADDICVLRINKESGLPELAPSYPVVRLWEDSFMKLNMDVPDASQKLRPGGFKYSTMHHSGYRIDASPVSKLVFLESLPGARGLSVKKLNKNEAFLEFGKNDFKPAQIRAMGKRQINLVLLTKLLTDIADIVLITRPADINTTEEIADIIIT